MKESVKRAYDFKPYYKWITFNTYNRLYNNDDIFYFKPYYKWITFNTRNNQ